MVGIYKNVNNGQSKKLERDNSQGSLDIGYRDALVIISQGYGSNLLVYKHSLTQLIGTHVAALSGLSKRRSISSSFRTMKSYFGSGRGAIFTSLTASTMAAPIHRIMRGIICCALSPLLP